MTNDHKDALSLIEAVIEGRSEMYVAGIVSMDSEELRSLVNVLVHLVDLRAKVGTDHESTAEWARWLRQQGPTKNN